MFDFLGLTAISLVSLITIIIALKYNAISKILLAALFVRIIFLIINNHIFYLPDGDMDALNFEARAWTLAGVGFDRLFDYILGPDPYFYSFALAIPYSLLGRSMLMAQSISIFFGIGCIILGWLVARKLWNDQTAIKVGWVMALFPSLISYSVLTMREVYITFFLLVAIYGIVNWVKNGGFEYFCIVIFGFVAATFFHGPLFVGVFVFSFVILFQNLNKSFKLIKNKIINIKLLLIIICVSTFFVLYFTNQISLPYLKTFDYISLDQLRFLMVINSKGDASYPDWLQIGSNNIEFFYKLPIRSLYFLFSPLPWDISKASHLIGMFDGFCYMILSYLIFCNRKRIWKDPALRIILLIVITYIFIFSVGVSNFGTGIRHRSKFFIELILLAGPLIPKIILFNKKKIKKNLK